METVFITVSEEALGWARLDWRGGRGDWTHNWTAQSRLVWIVWSVVDNVVVPMCVTDGTTRQWRTSSKGLAT